MNDTIVFIDQDVRGEYIDNRIGWGFHASAGAQAAIRRNGNHVLVFRPEKIESGLEKLLKEKPLGFMLPEIFGRTPERKIMEKIRAAGIPAVGYGDYPDYAEIDRVLSDHEQGAYELTKFLISLGRKRIAMMVNDCKEPLYWQKAKKRGYEKALGEAGLNVLPPLPEMFSSLPESGNPRNDFRAKVCMYTGLISETLLASDPPDAIMVQSDGIVFPVASACRKLGKNPETDVLVVGYDNYWSEVPDAAFENYRPVATVDKLDREIGKRMADLFYERIGGKLPAAPQVIKIPPKLVVTD